MKTPEEYSNPISLNWIGKQEAKVRFKDYLKFQSFSFSQSLTNSNINNQLYHCDNYYLLHLLMQPPLKDLIHQLGGIKLIYIDPPYFVGSDFTYNINLPVEENGDRYLQKISALAYQDSYTEGFSSYLSMMYSRLKLMHQALADDGTLYLHCDYRVHSYLRIILDEIFGMENYRNEIIWRRQIPRGMKKYAKHYPFSADYILIYTKSNQFIWNPQVEKRTITLQQAFKKYMRDDKGFFRTSDPGTYSFESLLRLHKEGRLYSPYNSNIIIDHENKRIYCEKGNLGVKYYRQQVGNRIIEEEPLDNIWDDIPGMGIISSKWVNYPTQKPDKLIERIIHASSKEGDLVADFYCGSGTFAKVADQMKRKWICSDLSVYAIQTTIKQLLQIKEGYSDFIVYKPYQAKWNKSIKSQLLHKVQRLIKADHSFSDESINLIKNNHHYALVFQDPCDSETLKNILKEALEKKLDRLTLLCFNMELDLIQLLKYYFKSKKQAQNSGSQILQPNSKELIDLLYGIDLSVKMLPDYLYHSPYNSYPVDNLPLYDLSFMDYRIIKHNRSIQLVFTDFHFNYSSHLSEKSSKIKSKQSSFFENGQLYLTNQTQKEKNYKSVQVKGIEWVDRISVDFNYKKEFHSHWNTFKTKNKTKIESPSAIYTYPKLGNYTIVIQTVDVFGITWMEKLRITIE